MSHFSKNNSLFGSGPIWEKLVEPYSQDLCGNCFEMTYHDWIQYLEQSNFGQIFQKIPFWGGNLHPIWDKIMQPPVLGFTLCGIF